MERRGDIPQFLFLGLPLIASRQKVGNTPRPPSRPPSLLTSSARVKWLAMRVSLMTWGGKTPFQPSNQSATWMREREGGREGEKEGEEGREGRREGGAQGSLPLQSRPSEIGATSKAPVGRRKKTWDEKMSPTIVHPSIHPSIHPSLPPSLPLFSLPSLLSFFSSLVAYLQPIGEELAFEEG